MSYNGGLPSFLQAPAGWKRRTSFADLGATLFAVALLLILAGALGIMSADYGTVAILVAIGVLAVGIASTDIVLLPVLAFPATLVMIRTGPLSVSDLVLAMAMLPAILLYRRAEAKDLQPLLWAGITYQALLVPTLLLNPYAENFLEWVHELVLVIGGLLVGWVVGRHGKARTALNFYLVVCVGISIAAVFTGFYMLVDSGSFGPVYLPSLHKNFIGNTLAFALLMVWVRPDWLGWNRQVATIVMVICAAGIAASGSRQAMVSVFVAIAILALRSRAKGGGRGRVLLLALLPGVFFVANSVSDQLEEDNPFNSVAQRLAWFTEALDIWQTSPLFGVGLRWWYTGNYSSFQPPNAFFEMISSAGIVGLIGFLVLCLSGLWVVLTLPPRYGNIAAAIMLARFTQGQLDLYWVAGQASIPWMMAGLVIGALSLERSTSQGGDLMPAFHLVRQSNSSPRRAARATRTFRYPR